MASAGVNPAMLRWARERAGLSLEEAQASLGKKKWKHQLPNWESPKEKASPTFEQARALAAAYRAPLASLFLDEPIDDSPGIPDLRTIGDRRGALSVDLRDVLLGAQRKRDWLRSYRLKLEFDPVAFVGKSSLGDKPDVVAQRLQNALGVSTLDRAGLADWGAHKRELVKRAEATGVTVLQSSTVGNFTHRPLSVDEFRGFALADELAPLVFVNTADVRPAQIFTLIHELAHLAIASSGVSNAPIDEPGELAKEEAFCNAVAAEFLVPLDEFLPAWDGSAEFAENAVLLSRRFKVSRMVIARRAFDQGLVSGGVYWPFVKRCVEKARSKRLAEKEKSQESKNGPGYYKLVRSRHGAFTDTVVRAARAGVVLYRDAAGLLDIRPKGIDKLAGVGR